MRVSDLCNIREEAIKKVDPVTNLCNIKGNEPLKQCATAALLPICDIKDSKIKNAVISDMNKALRQRDKKGNFVKERLTQPEVEEIICKYDPKYKRKNFRDNQTRPRLSEQHKNTIKKIISLNYASGEREAFNLIFKWAQERIAEQVK